MFAILIPYAGDIILTGADTAAAGDAKRVFMDKSTMTDLGSINLFIRYRCTVCQNWAN